MGTQNPRLASATPVAAQSVVAQSVAAQSVAALLPGGPGLSGVRTLRRTLAPINGRLHGAALSADRAWVPGEAAADQTCGRTVFTKYTYVFVKHDPGDTAPRPPV